MPIARYPTRSFLLRSLETDDSGRLEFLVLDEYVNLVPWGDRAKFGRFAVMTDPVCNSGLHRYPAPLSPHLIRPFRSNPLLVARISKLLCRVDHLIHTLFCDRWMSYMRTADQCKAIWGERSPALGIRSFRLHMRSSIGGAFCDCWRTCLRVVCENVGENCRRGRLGNRQFRLLRCEQKVSLLEGWPMSGRGCVIGTSANLVCSTIGNQ